MTAPTVENWTTETAEKPVTLTQTAADKLLGIMDEKGLRETHALRVFISGGGCSGLQYGMAFDDNPRESDVTFEEHGLRVVIDPRSLPYMVGANIDYVDSLMGGGFHIENPNAVSSCGCGHSFRAKEGTGEAEDEAGCGSGCSCH
jgi:iron-sulfur cluster assembly accessory protein